MRKIKFRGKRIATGEWIYGGFHLHEKVQLCVPSLTKEEIDENEAYLIISDGMADWMMPKEIKAEQVFPETIGQFTGLTDMNGKEIYEGDILSYDYGDNTQHEDWMKQPYYVVTFNEDRLITHGVDLLYPKKNMFLYSFRFRHTEVMGNIHDNPELLNKQNK